MNRPILATLAVLVLTAPFVAALATPRGATNVLPDGRDWPTIAEWGQQHPGEWPATSAGTEGMSAVDAASHVMRDVTTNGRTPHDWIEEGRSFNVALPTSVPAAPADADGSKLVSNVLRIEASLGVPVLPVDLLTMNAQAMNLRPDVRAAFADLLGTVADAYASEVPIARNIEARLPAVFDVHTVIATQEERDAMAANAHNVLDALNLFNARTANAWKDIPATDAGGNDPPLFADPEGLIILGGTGDGTYARSGTVLDPVLIVEPSGNDLYQTTAGGACPDAVNLIAQCNLLALSAVYDIAGNDVYAYSGPFGFAQGTGGIGGVGILADVAGDDTYQATMVRTAGSSIFMYIDGGAQGYALGGVGVLVDGAGNDVYNFVIGSTNGRSAWALGQGFGSAGGLGVIADFGGSDQWLSSGLGITGGTSGFQGIYPYGTGFYGGVGLMLDIGQSDDLYYSYDLARTTDFYAYGFAAFGGTGIEVDDGGDDDYTAVSESTNPFINPLLNCDFGSASYGGFGIFVDLGGNDRYYGDTISPKGAYTMIQGFGGPAAGYGLFVDVAGNDQHIEYAHGATDSFLSGRGVFNVFGEQSNIVGTFVDSGGVDTYVGPGADSTEWPVGVDANVVPEL